MPAEHRGEFGYGDVWTFIAIDAEMKLIPPFVVGSRDAGTATHFCQDLTGRLDAPAPGSALFLRCCPRRPGCRPSPALLMAEGGRLDGRCRAAPIRLPGGRSLSGPTPGWGCPACGLQR